ncbi:hypothetical protein E2C01_062753 [Portunus trituberculatus]|uniref:Uncharacterized protein n=1 Tax=Portunus trituberculatus TaxID=210409 RepID=A0A5B7H7B3_PORTR|nr:hypothetical protein [Portunus trituberculatus]
MEEWDGSPINNTIKQQISNRLETLRSQHRQRVESDMIKKLAKLLGDNIKLPRPNRGYTNLTDVVLTQDQEDILNMGIQCHYLTKPRPHRKRLEIETLLDDIQELEKKEVTTSPNLQPSLLAEEGKTLRELKDTTYLQLNSCEKTKEIVIRRADKTPAFVLIKKEEYDTKLNAILSDTTKFTRNPAESLKKRVNATFTSINAASNNLKLQKIIGEFSPVYAYGNVKRHKQNNPNTYLRLPTIYMLDVESLFTNVPVDKTLGFILNRVYHSSDTTRLDIPEKHIKVTGGTLYQRSPVHLSRRQAVTAIRWRRQGQPTRRTVFKFFHGHN